jgi:hypothetical protein
MTTLSQQILGSLSENFKLCSELFSTENFCIAGGAIVNTINQLPIKDIDCFFKEEQEYLNAVNRMNYRGRLIKKRHHSHVFELEDKTQLDMVFVSKEHFQDIISDFDLLHCQMYYTPKDGVVSNEGAISCALAKHLVLGSISLPWHTMARIAKKKNQGWTIDSTNESNMLQYLYKAHWGFSKEEEYVK